MLLSALLLTSLTLSAQTFNYNFSTFTEAYTPLTGTENATTSTWDDPEITVPIGFSFSFEGYVSDELYFVGLGGIVAFDQGLGIANTMVVYSSDLIDAGNNEGVMETPIRYKTEGAVGSRIFKMEWPNVAFYNNVGTANEARVSIQLWLYENSNDWEVRFGPSDIPNFDDAHDGLLTCGILSYGIGGITGHLTTGPGNSPTITTIENEFDFATATLTSDPSNGTVYRFGATFVGVEENVEDNTWTAYPNPATDNVLISTASDELVQYDLLDLSGRIIQNGQIIQQKHLDVSDFETGIYLIRLSTASSVKTLQLVVK